MFPAIRDAMLNDFECIHDGLKVLDTPAVELELTHDFEVRGLEIPGWVSLHSDTARASYQAQCDALGIKVCALLTAIDLGETEPADAAQWLAQAMDIAEALDVSIIRIDPLMKKEGVLTFQERVQRMVDTLQQSIDLRPDSPTRFGIENHGFYCNSPVYLDAVLSQLPAERVGLTLDTGNFYWWGFPRSEVYALLQQYAPRTVYVHAKNIAYPEEQAEQFRERGWEYGKYWCALHEGSLDLKRIVQILRDAAYTGPLCIEDECITQRGDYRAQTLILQEELDYLKSCL